MAKKEMTGKELKELALINRLTGKKYKTIGSARKYIKDSNLDDVQSLIDSRSFNDEYEGKNNSDEELDEMNNSLLYQDHKYTSRSIDLCNANLGQRIRYFRQIAGMTQKELADKCEVNESTIRNYELGNRYPDTDTLNLIAASLEVSVFALSATQEVRMPQSALKFLFDMEKYYLIKPVEIDGRMYIGFDTEALSDEDDIFFPPYFMENLLRVWERFYNIFKSGEIDETTYLLWQSKYPTFATTNPDDIFGKNRFPEVDIDAKISDAKKRFRKIQI